MTFDPCPLCGASHGTKPAPAINGRDLPIVAWAYYCDLSFNRSPFIRYTRMESDKSREAPWMEVPLYDYNVALR